MSEIKLFRINNGVAAEVPGQSAELEKSIQTLIEKNLDTMLGVRFVASEYGTGKLHGGRIDSLGLDEDNCPVIVEYKRATNENVVNQGLFYLDWLLDHKAEFKLLVMERFGNTIAAKIDWVSPRLICIAGDFTKYDEHAVRQMNRNIDLFRYSRFGSDLFALELLTSTTADVLEDNLSKQKNKQTGDKPVSQSLAELDASLADVWAELRAFALGLGSDVTEKQLKLYVAFRRIKNFATVAVQKKGMYVYLAIDPSAVVIEQGFTRDVTEIGHWGTGDLEIWISDKASLKKALPLIAKAYQES